MYKSLDVCAAVYKGTFIGKGENHYACMQACICIRPYDFSFCILFLRAFLHENTDLYSTMTDLQYIIFTLSLHIACGVACQTNDSFGLKMLSSIFLFSLFFVLLFC